MLCYSTQLSFVRCWALVVVALVAASLAGPDPLGLQPPSGAGVTARWACNLVRLYSLACTASTWCRALVAVALVAVPLAVLVAVLCSFPWE